MIARLYAPGGPIGIISTIVALILGAGGIAAILMMLTGLWAESTEDVVAGVAFGGVMLLGVYGFSLQSERPVMGAALAMLGALAGAAFYFWALLPFLLIPITAVLVTFRGRRMAHS